MLSPQVIDMDLAQTTGEFRINPEWNDDLRVLRAEHDELEQEVLNIVQQVRHRVGGHGVAWLTAATDPIDVGSEAGHQV